MSERPDFERVLAEHRSSATQFCSGCDWWPTRSALDANDHGDAERDEFRAHLADALNAEVTHWLADEGLAVISGVSAWCAINEIAAPPLDWAGLGLFLERSEARALAALALTDTPTDTTADEKGAGR